MAHRAVPLDIRDDAEDGSGEGVGDTRSKAWMAQSKNVTPKPREDEIGSDL